MKAFLVGLAFLIALPVLSAIGYLILSLLTGLLQLLIGFAFTIFAIWLLGKLVIWVWEKLKKI